MAERPEGFGFTAEIHAKLGEKYNPELAKEAMEWVLFYLPDADLHDDSGEVISDSETIHEKLQNGVILCNLINVLEPDSIMKINTSKMAFKQMENIGNFLNAIGTYGVVKTDSFQTVDLYEGQNMANVIFALHGLGRKAAMKGKHGIGPKESEKNTREFTEEQMRAGEGMIGLQMGSNKFATQAGQNFGKTRHIID